MANFDVMDRGFSAEIDVAGVQAEGGDDDDIVGAGGPAKALKDLRD